MKCEEKGCDGEVGINNLVELQVGRTATNFNFKVDVHRCSVCGRLYWDDCEGVPSSPVFTSHKDKVFFENGRIIHRKAGGAR